MSRADRLESWKEIAAYLKRDVRTVQRWERMDGLPIRRDLPGSRRVFAYPDELEAWLARAATKNAPADRPATTAYRAAMSAAVAISLAAALIAWLSIGRHSAAARTVERVWDGHRAASVGAVSPDGRLISYIDVDSGDLLVRENAAATIRPVSAAGNAGAARGFPQGSTFSRDSARIAYAWSSDRGAVELRVAAIDGKSSRVVRRHPEWRSLRPAAWTSSGTDILCLIEQHDSTDLAFIPVSGGTPRVVRRFGHAPPRTVSLSPDDRVIVYDMLNASASGARDIVAVASDGSREGRIAVAASDEPTPVWTPDGRFVVFVSDRGGAPAIWAVRMSGVEASQPFLLKGGVPVAGVIGFARNGTLHYLTHPLRTDVYVASLDAHTGAAQAISLRGRFAGRSIASDWSPDGSSLVYLSQREAHDLHRALMIQTLASGRERELVPPLRNAWSPRWSPDGRSILIAAQGVASAGALYLLDIVSGRTELILERDQPVGAFGPEWSPDGRWIVFVEGGHDRYSIIRFERESGRAELVYAPERQEVLGDVSVSPDGRTIAFRASALDAPAVTWIKLVAFAGGEARELIRFTAPESAAGPVWTRDGRHLLFVKSHVETPDRRELWRVDVATRTARSTGMSAEGLRYVRVHPDGRQVAFSTGGPRAEVWAVRNLALSR